MLKPIKVLLVDDEPDFIETLAQRLELRGFEVAAAESADQGLALLAENPVDVTVLDVLMPGKDGIQALREIKAAHPIIEVIMLTGHATVETAIEGMKLGAYDYMMKPTDTDDLAAKITKAHTRKKEHEDRIREAEINEIIGRKGW